MNVSRWIKVALRIVVTTIAGGIVGAFFGALIFAFPKQFDSSPMWIGRVSDFVPFFVLAGAFEGFYAGLIIGLISGIARPSRIVSNVIGVVAGIIVLASLLIGPGNRELFAEALSLQSCILISVITGAIARSFLRGSLKVQN